MFISGFPVGFPQTTRRTWFCRLPVLLLVSLKQNQRVPTQKQDTLRTLPAEALRCLRWRAGARPAPGKPLDGAFWSTDGFGARKRSPLQKGQELVWQAKILASVKKLVWRFQTRGSPTKATPPPFWIDRIRICTTKTTGRRSTKKEGSPPTKPWVNTPKPWIDTKGFSNPQRGPPHPFGSIGSQIWLIQLTPMRTKKAHGLTSSTTAFGARGC